MLGSSDTVFGLIAPGPVNFSQNRCSLYQTWELKSTYSSVWISTYDDLGFTDNQCLVATNALETDCDAILLGATIRVTGCRFQEVSGRVYLSALTARFLEHYVAQSGHARARADRSASVERDHWKYNPVIVRNYGGDQAPQHT